MKIWKKSPNENDDREIELKNAYKVLKFLSRERREWISQESVCVSEKPDCLLCGAYNLIGIFSREGDLFSESEEYQSEAREIEKESLNAESLEELLAIHKRAERLASKFNDALPEIFRIKISPDVSHIGLYNELFEEEVIGFDRVEAEKKSVWESVDGALKFESEEELREELDSQVEDLRANERVEVYDDCCFSQKDGALFYNSAEYEKLTALREKFDEEEDEERRAEILKEAEKVAGEWNEWVENEIRSYVNDDEAGIKIGDDEDTVIFKREEFLTAAN